LLVCIAALLAAVVITRQVGDANIAKTSASNAADAGSLSAASCMAGAFNRLVFRNLSADGSRDSEEATLGAAGHLGNYMGYSTGALNTYYYYKEMKNYYKQMRDTYMEAYNAGNNYLAEASRLIGEAIVLATDAKELISHGEMGCSNIWNDQDLAADKNRLARDKIHEAALCVGAFNVCTAYMQKITSWFKWGRADSGGSVGGDRGQLRNFCDALAFMDESYKRAIQTGQYYAMSNSGYTSSLTSGQSDAFNFWLGGSGPRQFPPSTNGALTYPPDPSAPGCKITADVQIPSITKYQVNMAMWNFPQAHTFTSIPISCTECACSIDLPSENFTFDPFNIRASKKLTDDLYYNIHDYFESLALKSEEILKLTQEAADCCKCTCPGGYSGCGECGASCGLCCETGGAGNACVANSGAACDYDAKYTEADKQRTCLMKNEQCIIDALNDIVSKPAQTPPAASPSSIASLKKWNDDIWTHVWPGDGGLIFPIDRLPGDAGCQDTKEYLGVADDLPNGRGMMVINVEDVTLSGPWEVSCTVTASCGASSFSKSKFTGYPDTGEKGKLVGQFKDIYYPEIIEAN